MSGYGHKTPLGKRLLADAPFGWCQGGAHDDCTGIGETMQTRLAGRRTTRKLQTRWYCPCRCHPHTAEADDGRPEEP